VFGRALRGTGELLITAGVVTLLFVVYLLYWTDLENSRTQDRLSHGLTRQWADGAVVPGPVPLPTTAGTAGTSGGPSPVAFAAPRLGDALARLYIPRLGRDYHPVVVEGISTADLELGPGHYPGTAEPGGKGNTVISGHRTTWGKPFNRLADVQAGDHVVIETRTSWITYRVTGEQIVQPDATQVIGDVPPPIGDQPPQADHLLTLTTCNPEYSAAQRLILRAVLVGTEQKKAGAPPAALVGGT